MKSPLTPDAANAQQRQAGVPNRRAVVAATHPARPRDRALDIAGHALERPTNLRLYEGEVEAVSLLFAITSNHPFEQGNKRTGFETLMIFLDANGYAFIGPDHESLAHLITAVVTHDALQQAFEDAVRPLVILRPPET